MKIMTCQQLGGACELEFKANSFDEIAEMRKQHGMEMFKRGDQAHLEAMQKMQKLMQAPEDMQAWFTDKKKAFDNASEVQV